MRSVSRADCRRAVVLALATFVIGCHPVAYEQTYLRASHNYAFRDAYPEVDALFNAFDFGHAALYEAELTHPSEIAQRVDTVLYRRLTTDVLRRPSHVTLDEHAIAPSYSTLAPELVASFEWAHMLHRQLYDVLADARIADSERDARVATVLRYYHTRPDLAFSTTPKSMALMEGQPFSLGFRRSAPAYNALIWSYHWLQMAQYEALLARSPGASRDSLAQQTVVRFWMLVTSRGQMPAVMPMSPAIAPRFARRYPEAAIVFDNLHALHDVVSDILASDRVPRPAKRAALLRALREYQDNTTAVTTRDEWVAMAEAMGARSMGGVGVP
jgi:hypothetical protein